MVGTTSGSGMVGTTSGSSSGQPHDVGHGLEQSQSIAGAAVVSSTASKSGVVSTGTSVTSVYDASVAVSSNSVTFSV